MNNQQLIQVQRAIEQFFVKVRVNVPLYDILRSELYIEFEKDMRLAIENQILYFAKVEKVNQVIGVQKIDSELLKTIFLYYPLLQEFVNATEFKDYLSTVSTKGIESAKNVVGIEREVVIKNLDKILSTRVATSMEGIDDTTVRWIAQRLSDGVKSGASSYEIAKMLRDLAKDQAEMRAQTIAEQEAAWALGETQLRTYKAVGVQKKKLITSRDELVCPICIADETVGEIGIDAKFPSGAVATPIHIRCRCFIMPIIAGVPLAVEG